MKYLITFFTIFIILTIFCIILSAQTSINPIVGNTNPIYNIDFLLKYWVVIALIISELASLLPPKYSGIVKSICTILTGNYDIRKIRYIYKSKSLKP